MPINNNNNNNNNNINTNNNYLSEKEVISIFNKGVENGTISQITGRGASTYAMSPDGKIVFSKNMRAYSAVLSSYNGQTVYELSVTDENGYGTSRFKVYVDPVTGELIND